MSLKILLVSFNRYTTPDPVYPLGLTYVADSLKGAGHEVEFIDLLSAEANWAQSIQEFSPDLVGISVRNVDEVCITSKGTLLDKLPSLVQDCRSLCAGPVVIGGPAVSLFPKEILEMSGADYAIKGEGEHAFIHICECLENQISPSAPWLLSRNNNATDNRASYSQTDQKTCICSAPAGFCTHVDIEVRKKVAPFYLKNSRMLNIQTQRGCPLKCSYCTYPSIEGRKVRHRSIEVVIEELRVIKELGAKYFFVVDGVFNTSNSYVKELCEAIIRAELKLRWCCFIKPSRIDMELATLMARAGLTHAECGSDSLSDSMLYNYGKRFSFEDLKQSSMNLMKAGIKICHFIIFGGIGETRDTIRETFERSREIPGSIFFCSTGLRVYPNTPLYASLLKTTPELANISMLKPYYYLSPEFTEQSIREELERSAMGRSEWILTSDSDEYQKEMQKMRRKGKTGPLWDYMEIMQRFRYSAEAAAISS